MIWLLAACRDEPVPAAPAPTEPPVPSTASSSSGPEVTDTWTDGHWTTTVEVIADDGRLRTYVLRTDHAQRDGAPQEVTVTERDGRPRLRSGSLVLDALLALAVHEAELASVDAVSDGAFAGGAPFACRCWQTGELWTWAWTRDTAYAVDLGLAWLDPERSAETLRFRLSEPKPGLLLEGPQIVQDTGTGGSWPVSTDRVVWALGARAVLRELAGEERAAFRDLAHDALAATAALDDRTVRGPDGLYRGETSFLDWREQSYPPWTAADPARIAERAALSTNVAQLVLRETLAALAAERGDAAASAAWQADADALRDAIHRGFRVEEDALWASFRGGPFDPGPVRAYDALGNALAVLEAVGGEGDAAATVAAWPWGPEGPPVLWPQRPEPPVYHNRAIWPFVTAYQLRAARAAGNDAAIAAAWESLARGAVTNLSHVENLEWWTGEPHGPVVHSRRQLWSIGAFLALVAEGLAGRGPDGTLAPLLPAAIRDRWLGDEVVLSDLPVGGRPVEVHLRLPARGGAGPLVAVGEVWEGDRVTLTLAPGGAPAAITRAAADLQAPATPEITVTGAVVAWTPAPGALADVLRDGVVVAEGIAGSSWTDPAPPADAAPCYAVELVADGLRSHRSAPVCAWGDRVQVLDAYAFAAAGRWATDHGRPHVADWGDPEDVLEVLFRPAYSGEHLVQLVYANGGPVSTGLTAGHKHLRIEADGVPVAEGPIVLPHTGGWDQWRDATALPAVLDRDTTYRLVVSDLPNASWLAAATDYTGGAGGGPLPFNAVDLAEVKLLARAGTGAPRPGDHVALDGTDDVGAFDPAQRATPGIPLADWDQVALTWDEDFLYVALASPAFEDPFVPLVLYLEADPAGPPTAGAGLSYAGLAPALPFAPTHAIALRRETDAGDGIGPWAGVWVPDGAGWRQIGRLAPGAGLWAAADLHTLSARIPRWWLGDAAAVRLVAHVVHALPGEEWKDVLPAGHTPWAGGGAYYEIDLAGPTPIAGWTVR